MTMNEPIDIEVVRTEALRKLGRNIVNFSKIEGILKYLLSVSQFEGTEEIPEQLRKNHARLRKQTLGTLVREFHKHVVVDASQIETATASSASEIVFYSKVSSTQARKRALLDIVVERNKLIHQDLALLDISCVEDYRTLIGLLDEQNPRLLAHLEELGWILKSMSENWQVLGDFLKSPEFLQYIQSSQTDA